MSEPRRIAFCITDLDAGGAERALVQIVTGLPRSEWEAKVFCLSGPGELVAPLEQAGVPVECLGATSPRSLGVVRRLTRALRDWRPDILQSFMFHANMAGRYAAWRAGVPLVVCGLRVAERDARWRMRLDRWTQRLVTRYIAVSRGVADFSANEVRLPREKIVVIPNGVDVERFRRATAADLTQFGIPAGSRVITFIGRLHPQKAPDVLIEAAAAVLRLHDHVHLLLVGDGPLRGALDEQSWRLGVSDRIHLVGRQADVGPLLKASSMCVLPSRWEGMPNVVLEAMACGCPVIASNVEGSRELIQHDATGRLFPVDDVAALTGEIAWVLTHPDEARTLSETAQLVVSTEFAWSRVVTGYHRVYTRLLNPEPDVDNEIEFERP